MTTLEKYVWIVSTLYRAGDMIEVLEPESLRHEMYTLAKRICNIYRKD